MIETIKRLAVEEQGADATEYALLASLVAVALIVGATALGGKINNVFNSVQNKMTVATEKAYLTAFRRFVAYVSARGYSNVNVVRVQENIKLLQRSEGRRIPDVDIDGVKEFLGFVESYAIDFDNPDQAMRDRRDRAHQRDGQPGRDDVRVPDR